MTRAELTSLEEVAEAVRKEPAWAGHFAGFGAGTQGLSAARQRYFVEAVMQR